MYQRSITEFAGAAGAAVQARENKASDLSTPLLLRKAEKKRCFSCEYARAFTVLGHTSISPLVVDAGLYTKCLFWKFI